MRNFYAGNPEAMAKLEGIISDRDNFDGDIEAYWKKYKHTSLANPDLKHLTSVQIDYLQDHQPDVYKLLCRMGCYRYQAVPTIPHEGLICLMWDVLESQHNAIIERLKKYSLIKLTKGEYYLHPATREAAKQRLEENKLDWEIANQKAAQFWEEQVKTIEIVDDALKAFESYYHYLAIDNHNAACETITREREYRWEKHIEEDGRLGEPLGYSYLRLGLLESITVATQAVLLKTDKQLILARACNLLGDLLWLTGKPYIAISYHEKTHDIALNKHNEYPKLKRLHYSSLLNRGLCYLSLWEVKKAHSFFLDLQNLSLNGISEQEMIHLGKYNLFRSNFCLSLTYSLIGDKENSLICIDKSILTSNEQIFYSAWSKGYSLIFIAQAYKDIRYLEKSNTKYQEAIEFADDSNYFQVKAMALYGIGELERINYKYFSALSYIQSAVEILQKIQAKHDLSEAYFQLGLTYQAMGEYDQTEEYKAKALKLFEQMEAPKQIERVNKAFEQGAIK